jgi:hypothetical protein
MDTRRLRAVAFVPGWAIGEARDLPAAEAARLLVEFAGLVLDDPPEVDRQIRTPQVRRDVVDADGDVSGLHLRAWTGRPSWRS